MHVRTLTRIPAIASIVICLAAAAGSPALADQTVQTPQAPLVVIHSVSGLVSVVHGVDGSVQISGGGNATTTTFQVDSDTEGTMFPRGMGLPPRRFTLPGIKEGTTGVRIENTGGDITVSVPARVAAVLVRLDDGDAALSDFRGPYVVSANGGSVDLRSLAGFGHVRTTNGRVTLTRVGGNLHVETTQGSVMATGMSAERADIKTQGGDIEWDFARLSGGPYSFTSGAGNVRLALGESQAASIDAQSTQGSVVNKFTRKANMRFRSTHAMSMSLRGGGPEITATSGSGLVEIGPHR